MTPQQRTVNCLKDLQTALRGLILDVDKIQLSLTKLPPPRRGPNGGHHNTLKRRRATVSH
jgi:hypothetical protein